MSITLNESQLKEIALLHVESDDVEDGTTIAKYLQLLLKAVWAETESFDGKRPFGNSGWEYDLYIPLVKAGFIDGKIDKYGDVDDIDTSSGDQVIFRVIGFIFSGFLK